jgi:hypothetical protein
MNARHLMSALAMLAGLVLGHTSASAQGVPLFAYMNGGNEVTGAADPPAGLANQGDLDGYGSATVTLAADNLSVCFAIIVVGIDAPTAAHIHQGRAGVAGPIKVTLTPPGAGDPGTSSGCAAASANLVKAIRTTPSNYYVNVHTGAFPKGAVRGQLF